MCHACAAMRHSVLDMLRCCPQYAAARQPQCDFTAHAAGTMHGLSCTMRLSRTYCCSRPISLLLVSCASSRNKRSVSPSLIGLVGALAPPKRSPLRPRAAPRQPVSRPSASRLGWLGAALGRRVDLFGGARAPTRPISRLD